MAYPVRYTAEEVRAAVRSMTSADTAERIMESLRRRPEHAFADNDTVTVAELRGAWERVSAQCMNVSDFLRDISEHREPEYEQLGVYRDAQGVYYRRHGAGWRKFGSQVTFHHDIPKRPLERMP